MQRLYIISLLLLVLSGCGKKEEKTERPAPFVEVAKVVSQEMPYILQTIGNTAAYASVDIRPQVSGQVTGYYFQDGAFISKGDLLYTIDPSLYAAELEEAQGLYQQAVASLEFNKQRVERYAGLLPEDYVSVLNYIQYVSDKGVAEGQLTEYTGSVDKASVNLGYCTINAPISGRLGKHLVDPGNIVSANQEQMLVTINQLDPIYADFTLAERFFNELMQYDLFGLPVEVNVVGYPKKVTGTLDFVNNTVNTNAGTINLRAIFENKEESLWPGQFVDVRIILYTIPNALVVPQLAVQYDTQGPFVYVAKEDQTVEIRRVTLGQLIDKQQVIQCGVTAGETVVTTGQISLSPGAKYQIKAENDKA